ncbi:hypothetical protein Csp1_21860 [Corynebacterium provencense]|uniref:YbjN domain-containing protein n=1 Tax=Corynebacterium provencense TaxID=1737425 RepID=A0A2Z3YRL3_9CORY|nr:YbjN domain-containing protein [Corynebacterium provencense]AWT26939.1 hypothetical protein Csp1_21860 [Corynebacterium provencense]
MFGRRKAPGRSRRTVRQWRHAPDPGETEILPSPQVDPHAASAVLHRVLTEIGGDRPVTQVGGFAVATTVRTAPLTFALEGLWEGQSDSDSGKLLTLAGTWNAGHTVPRAQVGVDRSGRVTVTADSELVCGVGVTVQQLDEWLRRALAGFSAFGSFLAERGLQTVAGGDRAGGDRAGESGDRQPDAVPVDAVPVDAVLEEVAHGDVTAAVTPGNRFGLVGGRTPAVLLARIGTSLEGRTEHREPGASGRRGNGYLRFAAGADVALHDGTLSVTDGVTLGSPGSGGPESDDDTNDVEEWLRALCNRVNTLPGGVVAVFDRGTLTCAVHRPVGSGLSDAQLDDAVSRDRRAVGEMLRLMAAEISGEADA